MNEQDPIISVLLEENILDKAGVEDIIRKCENTGMGLINILKSENLVDKDQLTKLTAISNGIEFITLSPDSIDPVAARLVSYELARQYSLIPIRIEKDTLFVAMSSPLNLSARDMITTKTGYKVVPMAATADAVRGAIACHFNVESVTKQDIVTMRLKGSSSGDKTGARKPQSAKITDAPIVRLVDSMITGAIEARASDIHIEPEEPDMRVRYRVDGILIEALKVPASANREVISHIKILAEMDISEKRVSQDGYIRVEHHGKAYDLRISSLPAMGGEKIVMRILDSSAGLKSLDEIVSCQQEHESLSSLIADPYGMILLTGPTGSGKTTTLYSMIQALNTPERNIVTVEDPVEYRLDGITQTQVKPEIGRTFASGLRSILRQDPDIILVGEIRDLETAEIAISAAQTGHLVLSTLHTNDAVGAISRLLHLGIQPFRAASCMLGAVAQRLVRTVCTQCKEPYNPPQQELDILFADGQAEDSVVLYKGSGCDSCRKTGYMGRHAIYEVLQITSAVKRQIVEGNSDVQIKSEAMKQGFQTLRTQGISQVLKGKTTLAELLRVINMREE